MLSLSKFTKSEMSLEERSALNDGWLDAKVRLSCQLTANKQKDLVSHD